MEENQSKNQEITSEDHETQVLSDAEIAELENSILELQKEEINFRHPQQVLTTREIGILLSKKEEDLNEVEKGALKLLIIRSKNGGKSRPKNLSTKERTSRKKKRKAARTSRKVNR